MAAEHAAVGVGVAKGSVMIEYLFRRKNHGKRCATWCGRYRIGKTGRVIEVSLNLTDRASAAAALRQIVIEAEREAYGLIPSKVQREAASASLTGLVGEYEADLKGRSLRAKHVHDTTTRLRRILSETKWRTLGDVRPDRFVKWRAGLSVSAKTAKEYQISLNAFLNWLVKTDRIAANPLARVDTVETRGKQVRACRAFTEDELRKLLAVSGKRKLAYQVLLYTGQRKSEVRALVWGDLHLDEANPFALFREGTTKDKDKRAVPLRAELASALRELRPAGVDPTKKVFWFNWPTYDILRTDLKKAGIERKDGLGRVVHFHSFRKTWQTLGVRHGVNQRAAQEILGHSDPSLTANVYTDVPALSLHSEMAKLPWISELLPDLRHASQPASQNGEKTASEVSLPEILQQLREIVQTIRIQVKTNPAPLVEAGSESVKWLPRLGSNQRPSD